ncbi:aminoglycoside phosphotransferase family protein [Micromonospora sp. NPDC048170]|uniref:phosphotransferase enzyme family protein n=1 Tax=Micromonospora sp. NPDC048170 TaxID=3154819 RepID=UPI00340FAE30
MSGMMSPLDLNSASTALQAACDEIGLSAVGATLIRLGDNAVFRLPEAAVIARVGRDIGRMEAAKREVAVSRWLAAESIPAVMAAPVVQPVAAGGRVVTFWVSASDREEYGTTSELAYLLRQLHSRSAPERPTLSSFVPFGRARSRIAGLLCLPASDRDYLAQRCEDLAKAYAKLDFALPAGVIHGDANVGNVIVDRAGVALLSDLDGFAIGPREWDLVLTAMYYERYGWHTEAEYQAFVQVYGYDLMAWPGYPVLSEVRELLMVAWLAQNAECDNKARAELTKRLSALRTGDSRRDWKPF